MGNSRVSYTEGANGNAQVVEENSYYAFGLQHKGYGPAPTGLGNAHAEKYKYNGKELNEELGLSWYDYGARNYDAAIGRWMNVDPLAEVSRRWSPYTYCYNDPIRFVDPDGMRVNYGEFINNAGEPDYDWDSGTYRSGSVEAAVARHRSPEGNSKSSLLSNAWRTVKSWFTKSKGSIEFGTPTSYPIFAGDKFETQMARNDAAAGVLDAQVYQETYNQYADVANSLFHGFMLGFGFSPTTVAPAIEATAAEMGSYSVYQGIDKAGVVRYTGITGRDPAIRFAEHLASGTNKSGLQYYVIDGASGLTKTQARVWEQQIINNFGLQKNGGVLYNKINSIAPSNWSTFGVTP